MLIDTLSSVLLRPRPEKWGLCGFSSFRCLSGQLRWEKCLEGGRGTTKSNSAWRDTSSMENLNPNIQLWQSHKQPKTACVVIEALCKWPVLQNQSLKSLSFVHIIDLIFAEVFQWWCDATTRNYNKLWMEKKQIGWKKLPILIVSSHHAETCSQKASSELVLSFQHNPHVCFWSVRPRCKILKGCENLHTLRVRA